MKKLSDFKDEKGISVAARVLSVIIEILANKKNLEQKESQSPLAMFSAFMENSPAEMKKIFSILSEKKESEYTCDGAEAMQNMLTLANDPIIVGLFISQSRTGGAKSSGSASENTKE